jgi:hypothetical protein
LEYIAVGPKTKGAFPGAIYEVKGAHTGAQWIGKLGSYDASTTTVSAPRSAQRRGFSRDAIKEKIATDFCWTLTLTWCPELRYETARAQLSRLPIMNEFLHDHAFAVALAQEVTSHDGKHVHILSQLVDGYHDVKQAQVPVQDGADPNNTHSFEEHLNLGAGVPKQIAVDGKFVPLRGMISLLVAARLLMDIDVLGDSCCNAGYVLRTDASNRVYGQVINIDLGYAFSFQAEANLLTATLRAAASSGPSWMRAAERKLGDVKDIQVGSNGLVVTWSSLSAAQQAEFQSCLAHAASILLEPEVVRYLVTRNGEFNRGAGETLLREQLVDRYVNDILSNARFQLGLYFAPN